VLGRRWRIKYLRTLPPSVFTPAPKVDSAVVILTPRPPGEMPSCDGAAFTRLVKRGFAQRRKLLRKNLGDEVPDWPALCANLGVLETARAEELDLAQWIALTNFLTGSLPASAAHAQDVHGEIFDVVDAEDRVIRQATRHEVHAQKLRHRAVHVFVFNQAGELFLQRRSQWKDKHPMRWDSSAAGHVNAGHTYDDTAPREIVEELGVSAPVEEIGNLPAGEGTGWEFVRLYRARHDGPFVLHPAEIDTGGWFSLAQLDRWTVARPADFAPGFLECYRIFRATASGPVT
jgi:16S rRNA (adenine1518-N6/adenine1519-N6)-dimethyltransferase